MDLYGLLAERYDNFFPLDPAAACWAEGLARGRGSPVPRVLETGCATGSLAVRLAERGCSVEGIDLDEGLLAQAQKKRKALPKAERGRLSFTRLDLRDARKAFEPGSFDAVLCLGNTLPHLSGPEEINAALEGFRSLLRPGGAIGLQIIDFDRIARLGLTGLPPLRGGGALFERSYVGLRVNKPFTFRARIFSDNGVPAGAASAEADTRLFALSRSLLADLLRGAGFASPLFDGGFSGEAADGTRLPLVVSARGLPKENASSVG